MKVTLLFIFLLIRKRWLLFLFIWLASLWLFLYLTSLDLFFYVISSPTFAGFEKVQFLLGSVGSIFRNLNDPRALSLLVFSFVASVNILLMLLSLRRRKSASGSGKSAVGSVTAIVGSHCLACGGSFAAPLITTLAGSGAFFSAERVNTAITLSVMVNIIGILLVGWGTLKLAKQEKNILLAKDVR